jgi:hypothetical protein
VSFATLLQRGIVVKTISLMLLCGPKNPLSPLRERVRERVRERGTKISGIEEQIDTAELSRKLGVDIPLLYC